MRVMVFVKATQDSEDGIMPTAAEIGEMMNFNEELSKAGVIVAGEGLHPSSRGVRVQMEGRDRTVIDGPFTEVKELVAGFWIWQVKSMDEAVEWARRCPNPMRGGGVLELRPIFEPSDFGDSLTPELEAREAELRAKAGGNA